MDNKKSLQRQAFEESLKGKPTITLTRKPKPTIELTKIPPHKKTKGSRYV